jgi:WD40 repeat protein
LKVEVDFSFKCHRDDYAHVVNAVAFSPRTPTLATGGSDCSAVLWHYGNRTKLLNSSGLGAPVTAIDFSADGRLLACGLGYDWHKGSELSSRFLSKIIVRDVSQIKTSQSNPEFA